VLVRELKSEIIKSLTEQGFSVNGSVEPKSISKNTLKELQQFSRKEQIKLHKNFIVDSYDKVQKHLINGRDINPAEIKLELREIEGESPDSIIYKWWNLVWWSVPFQRAYGRQMRFMLWDKTHNAPFGLIGLQSPILKMAVRDRYLEIPNETLDVWVNKSMQAQRLGALPPYNQLLGGKMVALAITASELRKAYKKKYKDTETILEKRVIEPDLLFVTTTSAFGRSSIYNRLKYNDELVAKSLGYTKGSGTFHIPQELYVEIQNYLLERGEYVNTSFGNGPSQKIKTLDKAFAKLKLNNYTYHNIEREFFLFPLAKNLKNVIAKEVKPKYYSRKLEDLTSFWKNRWCLPRAQKFNEWRNFNGEQFLVSTKRNVSRWSK
jgi:hypothetical protein